MVRGGKREGAGRKSRGIDVNKVPVYALDKEFLINEAKALNIPVVELVHQILAHKDFCAIMDDIKSDESLREWFKQTF